MAERIDILRELGLTPVWRLRARYRSDVVSIASHGAKEPPLVALPADARTPRAAHEPPHISQQPPRHTREPSRSSQGQQSMQSEHVARAMVEPDVRNRIARIAMLDWQHFAADVAACTACTLATTRNRTVPGVGDPRAEWLFVGEAPGAEEDARGEPFVGQAGRLLDSMLAALGMNRIKAVYIANVLKCRPPGNRAPTPLEVEACLPYLDRQIALVQPKLIVALGKSAATTLLRFEATIASLRGRVHRYNGVPLIVTYHPAYLLRNLPDKAKAWEDLCLARSTLRGILQPGIL
jgi:uracil-DNA glycosylase family 4